jgi:hypothetical protein
MTLAAVVVAVAVAFAVAVVVVVVVVLSTFLHIGFHVDGTKHK